MIYELTPQIFNDIVIPEIKKLFKKREMRYIKGSEIIQALISKANLPHDLAEEALKILIGEGVLEHANKTLKDIYSDFFTITDKIDNYRYIVQLEEPEEKLEIENLTTHENDNNDIIPVFEAPITIMSEITGTFTRQKELFKKLIKEANREIKIISPFMDETGLSNYIYELLKKCKAGIKIKILIRYDENRKRLADFLKNNLINACNNKVEIRYFHKYDNYGIIYSLHTKLIIVDDSKAYVGSGEIRKNSLFGFLCEAGVYLRGPIVETYSQYFDIIWREAKLL